MTKHKKNNDDVKVQVGTAVPAPDDVKINEPEVLASSTHPLVGKTISINLKAGTYFGVGDIWLTPDNYWAEVPDNLLAADYAVIERAIKAGTVQLGQHFIPPVEKASNTLEKYWLMIERRGFDDKQVKADFSMLLRRGQDSGWTALEIVNYCIEKEQAGKRRKEVIRLLDQVAKNYDGPLRLYDPPDTAEGIKKVTVNPDGTVLITRNSGTEAAKPVAEPPRPEGVHAGSKPAAQAINEIFS